MSNPWKLLTRTTRAFGEDHCSQMAAAIAYHVLFAFMPLIAVLLAAFGFLMRDPQQQQRVVDRLVTAAPPQSVALISSSIHSIAAQTGVLSVLGLAGLLLAANGLFGAIRAALDIVWGVRARRGFFTDKLLGLGAVLGLGVLLTASLAGTVMIHQLQALSGNPSGTSTTGLLQTFFTVLGMAVPAAFSFLVFLLLYRYVPNVRHTIGDVWPGALAAMVLFELAKHGFAFYVAHFNRYPALYGVLGAVMSFMLWSYLSATVMLIGAELASACEGPRHGRLVEDEPSVLLRENPEMVGR